jgi:four helix bundle protein
MNKSYDISCHHDLKVWQLGMEIAESVYRSTESFPSEERYGLTSQMRRSAISVPANIAEGNARSSTKEYLQYLSIAVGSLAELETFIELSQRFNLGNSATLSSLLEMIIEERMMLRGLQRSLRTKLSTPDL